MPRHHVNNFPPGTYVEHEDRDWIGTVNRVTVNDLGEPILVVDRAYVYVEQMGRRVVFEDTVRIHPQNIRRLNEGTVISRGLNEDD